jgi:hypothetical protein
VIAKRSVGRTARWRLRWVLAVIAAASFAPFEIARAQFPPPGPTAKPLPVERLGSDLLRIGNIRVDTAKKEMSVAGVVTDAHVLEFVAATKGGRKAYESAFELDATAIDFNLALILLGVDPSRSVIPKRHLDPASPRGDPVEVWVEWDQAGGRKKVRAENLIYNTITKTTIPEGPWVYTGSITIRETGAYFADVQGTLIGFVHTPSAVIDHPRALVSGTYGSEIINPEFNLKPGTPIQLSVRVLPRPKQ